VLERSLLPAETQQTLLERVGGNPLYAEQFAQLYLERGSAEDLPLPETLQGIVAARLDGLSAGEKAVLQDASVMGKVFWTGAIHRDVNEATPLLHSLERKGFVTRQRRSSLESESEWAFAHMLLRDVAYGQIPRAGRARKHREAAEWIESLGRPEYHAELLAHHWTSALELARAAGQEAAELEAPARIARAAAGDRAFSVNAYAVAATHYEGALALCPPDDPARPQLLYRRAHALYIATGDTALTPLEEACDALVAAREDDAAAEAEALLSRIWSMRGRSQESNEHLRRAERLAGETPSPVSARVLAFAARDRTLAGDHSVALGLATRALEVARALEFPELEAHALASVGTAKKSAGDTTGTDDLEEALGSRSPSTRPTRRRSWATWASPPGTRATCFERPSSTARRGASPSGSATGPGYGLPAGTSREAPSSSATGTGRSARWSCSSPSARGARRTASSR
jgi:predicted ATPase